MEKLAHFISWVFNPLTLPIYALMMVMYIPSDHQFFEPYCIYLIPDESKIAILKMFIFFGVAAPGVVFYWMYKNNQIESIEMNTQKERRLPIIFMFIFCTMLYLLILFFSGKSSILPSYIFSLPLSGAIVAAVFYFLNRWKKVSLHSASAGIMVGFIFAFILHHSAFQMWMLSLTFLISGLIMTTRLYLKKHSLNEVVIGWVLGTFITFTTVYFY